MEIQLQRYSEDAKNREEDLETAHAKLENMVKCRDSDKLMFQQRIVRNFLQISIFKVILKAKIIYC